MNISLLAPDPFRNVVLTGKKNRSKKMGNAKRGTPNRRGYR
jgi:hypothetical protein